MADHDTDGIQAIMHLYPRFDGKNKTHFLEYKGKLRVSLSFHRQSVAAILQGEPKPTTAHNSTAVATWTRANENLFGILFFTMERSAHNVVKKHMGKTREDGVGNGQAAWNALEKKYNSNTKEARRAYHEYLYNTKMKSGDDPDDFLYTMDGYRERLEDMDQPVPDDRYEDIILQALPVEYERVRTASYERRDLHLAEIRRMMSALYIDCLSRPNNSPSVVGCGVAMQLTGGGDIRINCHYCGNPGHRQKTCVAWIAAQCKGRNQHATRSTPFRRWKGRKRGNSKPMWCSFHKSATHSDETCHTQQQKIGDNGSANCTSQESDYHFVFNASDPTPRSNLEGQGISFAAEEVPTTDEPRKEQAFGPFGPTDEPVASFDISGLFSGSGGANSEETEGSTFEIEGGPVQRLGLWSHIVDILTTLARILVMAVVLHYVWLTFGSPYMTNTNGQFETICGITTAENGLALAARPAAGSWNRGSDVRRDFFSVEQDDALPGGESLTGIPEGGKPREQPTSLGEASSAKGVPQGGVLEPPEQPMPPGCEHMEAPLAGPLPLQHHGPSPHQVAPSATRVGSTTQSMRERNDTDCSHLVEIATDSTLSQLRGLGLYIEAFLTDIAHQTDEAESVVEYACAATKVQMYSAGEETENVRNTFEEATITGASWVYKINTENSIGQPRLVPTALERPSPSRRGIVISAPEKSTSGNEPVSIKTPSIDDRDLGRRVDDDKWSTGTDEIKDGAMDHEKGGEDEGDPQEGELRSGQRRDEVRRKFDSGHSRRFILFKSSMPVL